MMVRHHCTGRGALLGVLLLAAGGCTSRFLEEIDRRPALDGWGPRTRAEEPDAPPRPVLPPREPSGRMTLAGGSWQVHEISLGEVLALGGAQNLAVAVAREEARAAAWGEAARRAGLLPTLSLGPSYRRIDGLVQATGGEFVDVDKQAFSLGLGPRLRLELAEALHGPGQAELVTEAAVRGMHAATYAALLAGSRRYHGLLEAYGQLAVAREAQAHAAELADLVAERVEQGLWLRSRLLQARAALKRAEGRLASREHEVVAASASLVNVLDLDVDTDAMLVPAGGMGLIDFGLADAEPAGLLDRALRNRPDVEQARLLERAAELEVRRAEATAWLPAVVAEARGGVFGQNLGRLEDQEEVFLGLEWKLGAGVVPAIRRAEAKRSAASRRVRQLLNDVRQQILEARSRIAASHAAMVAAREEVEAAREARTVAQERLEAGEGLLLEVLELEAALTEATTNHLTALLEHNRAQYTLLHAVGGP